MSELFKVPGVEKSSELIDVKLVAEAIKLVIKLLETGPELDPDYKKAIRHTINTMLTNARVDISSRASLSDAFYLAMDPGNYEIDPTIVDKAVIYVISASE